MGWAFHANSSYLLCTVCGTMLSPLQHIYLYLLGTFSILRETAPVQDSVGQTREAKASMRVANKASILGFPERNNHYTTENLRRLFKSNQIIGDIDLKLSEPRISCCFFVGKGISGPLWWWPMNWSQFGTRAFTSNYPSHFTQTEWRKEDRARTKAFTFYAN